MIYINERKCIKAFYHWHLEQLNDGFASRAWAPTLALISNGGPNCSGFDVSVCKSNNADNVYHVRGRSGDDPISRAQHVRFRKPSEEDAIAEESDANVRFFSSVVHLYETQL